MIDLEILFADALGVVIKKRPSLEIIAPSIGNCFNKLFKVHAITNVSVFFFFKVLISSVSALKYRECSRFLLHSVW